MPNRPRVSGRHPTWGGLGSFGSGPPAPAPQPQSPLGQGAFGTDPNPGGQPLDPTEMAYQNAGLRNYQLAQGEGTYQQGQLDQTYGYGDTGAANPYSRAALLQENFVRSQRGTTNSYAASGQLYSGAYGRQQGENARQYSIASDANRRAYDAASHQIGYGVAQAGAAYGSGVGTEAYNALLRALGLSA
jgi:hypothetical protein